MLLRALLAVIFLAGLVSATSHARNHLRYLQILQNPHIRTQTHKVNALSHFDLEFELQQGPDRIKLSLEPNEDVIGHDATVSYLNSNGEIVQSEKINRLDHKVFKGTAWALVEDGTWVKTGWARISILKDGQNPLFEGVFSVDQINHHVKSRTSFMQTKHALDPEPEAGDDEYMVVFRDSDFAAQENDPYSHTDLKRDLPGRSCAADQLGFNTRPDHPVYAAMMKRHDTYWGTTPLANVFGKRQIDTQGSGNGALVNLVSTIGQTEGCPSTRKVALVGVATDCGYTANFNSTDAAKDHVIAVMNAASYVWENTFNISLGLQNLTISEPICPGSVQAATPWNQDCASSLQITDRLNLFSAWRGTLSDSNSHWTLLTKCPTQSAVGLAWLGAACQHSAFTSNTSDGVSETISGANVVALIPNEWQVVAHETGHTFGAVHDCDSSACQSNATVASSQCCPLSSTTCSASAEYIMNPYTSDATGFSPCTVGNICSAIRLNSVNTTCLVANKGIITVTRAVCGNGIVEEGEQCDCGGEAGCGDNACCDATTCKFKNNAICDDSNEDCCSNCQFATNGTVCRASTGVCDPQEICTGSSAVCPQDQTAPNGQSCTIPNSNTTGLSCASGQCTSRDLQCKTLMAGYFSDASSTYACDDNTCTLSCASPAFGPGVCYGINQNLLDGSSCGGGGQCSNGICKGSNLGKEIKSWIVSHKAIVIGVAVAVGILLLLAIWSCCCGCIRRRKGNVEKQAPYLQHNQPWTDRPPQGPMSPWHHSQDQGWRPPAGQQHYIPPPMPSYYAPPPPSSSPWAPQPWHEQQQQQQQRQFSPSPRSPPPPPPPPHHHQQLYGSGILGANGNSAWNNQQQQQQQQQQQNGPSHLFSPPPYPPPLRPSARYA